jgi:hypothetical protein
MNPFQILIASIGGTLACGDLIAAPPQSSPSPGDIEGELNVENDRTLQRTRMRLENEFIDYESGDSLNTLTYSGGIAFGFRGRKEWQLTLDWPLVAYRAGPSSTVGSATGMGDLEATFTRAFETRWKVRWSLGMKTRFATAMESQLGDGMYVLSPLAAGSWRLNPWVKLLATFQYNYSVAEREGVGKRRTLDFKPGVEFDLPGRWYGYVEYAAKRDFASGGSGGALGYIAGASLKFEIGSAWGRDDRLVLIARYEMPLAESSRRGTYVLGVSYRFK